MPAAGEVVQRRGGSPAVAAYRQEMAERQGDVLPVCGFLVQAGRQLFDVGRLPVSGRPVHGAAKSPSAVRGANGPRGKVVRLLRRGGPPERRWRAGGRRSNAYIPKGGVSVDGPSGAPGHAGGAVPGGALLAAVCLAAGWLISASGPPRAPPTRWSSPGSSCSALAAYLASRAGSCLPVRCARGGRFRVAQGRGVVELDLRQPFRLHRWLGGWEGGGSAAAELGVADVEWYPPFALCARRAGSWWGTTGRPAQRGGGPALAAASGPPGGVGGAEVGGRELARLLTAELVLLALTAVFPGRGPSGSPGRRPRGPCSASPF